MINVELFKEISPLSEKDCFILLERLKSNFNFPLHIHPEYELNFIENAKGAQRIVGDSIEEIAEQELVLITNPHLEHAWIDHNNTSTSIHEITIQFHADLLNDSFLNKTQLLSIRKLFQRGEKGVVFSAAAIAKVRPILKTLSCETDSFYYLTKLLVILHELSLDTGMRELATRPFGTEKSDSYENKQLEKAMEYIYAHYAEDIHLNDVAQRINMSGSSFCRLIKQHTSKNFVELLTDIRLGVASRRLIETSDSVAEIGYACGFNNLSNFNRLFKKKKGVPPTEFRKSYLRNRTII